MSLFLYLDKAKVYNLIGDFMEKNEDIIVRIKSIIDKVQPYLVSDGGNLEFVKYEDNIVYVRLLGACQSCPLIDTTLKDGIEELIVNEIPEVKEVRNID